MQKVDGEVPANDDGTIDAGYATDLTNKINTAINTNMVSEGNCDDVQSFIDPTQNIVQTSTLAVSVTLDPVGYSSTINVNLGL